MRTAVAVRSILLALFLPRLGIAQQAPEKSPPSMPLQKTLFVSCAKDKSKHVLGPVSLSENRRWRAYVEVDVQGNDGCLHTTWLWVTRANSLYRLLYLMPPKRTAAGNGMEILGWAGNSRVLLVETEEWQDGSDAPDVQQVLAIDAGTGMVYEPDLEAMLEAHKDKRCSFRVTDAGFSAERNVSILVRARFSTAFEGDETEEDVPPAERCGNFEETWSFNFATGEIKQVANTQPFEIFRDLWANQPGRKSR